MRYHRVNRRRASVEIIDDDEVELWRLACGATIASVKNEFSVIMVMALVGRRILSNQR